MGSGTRTTTGSVRAVFDGRLIERGSPDYEAARVDAIFNSRRPARFPVAVLEAASGADVIAGVRLARDRDWKVSVRSGGHS
jgi:FAD/FMN-containing dehydrogenase